MRTEYSFLPAVRLSLLAALAINPAHFDAFSGLRAHLETAYWDEAVALLTEEDLATLRSLVAAARAKLSEPRIQIPYQEHRELHLTIYRRLDNPFVVGLLEAYWDAYEAVELNTYADYAYLQEVWRYHERIVAAICQGATAEGKRLLIEHMRLLSARGVAIETLALMNGAAATPARVRA
jgi:DNA-binding FadR family transcriptional regulator